MMDLEFPAFSVGTVNEVASNESDLPTGGGGGSTESDL